MRPAQKTVLITSEWGIKQSASIKMPSEKEVEESFKNLIASPLV